MKNRAHTQKLIVQEEKPQQKSKELKDG